MSMIAQHKSEMRSAMRAMRSGLAPERREAYDQAIASTLLEIARERWASYVGIYSAKGSEADPQRFVDAWLSLPALFILLTVMALLGPGMIQMISVLGAFWGIANIRTVRGVVLSAKENLYVEAARAIGVPNSRILLRHILPQIVAPIITVFTVAGITIEHVLLVTKRKGFR